MASGCRPRVFMHVHVSLLTQKWRSSQLASEMLISLTPQICRDDIARRRIVRSRETNIVQSGEAPLPSIPSRAGITPARRFPNTHVVYRSAHLPSLHPTGTNAAATCCVPLSVANILNCAAAFLVSCTSILMPNSAMSLLVCGLTGTIFSPVPKINRSGFGHTRSTTPHTLLSTSNMPLGFLNFPVALDTPLLSSPADPAPIVPSLRPGRTHGRHLKASPPTSSTPALVTLRPESRAKPSSKHASTAVDGGAMLPSMFMAAKSVCVSSLLAGPRSRLFGGRDFGADAGSCVRAVELRDRVR